MAAYIMLGVTLDGKKEILGIWIGENETSKYWLTLLNELKNRGVEDVLIFAIDGLNGFNQAIEAVYPKAEIQRCIVHPCACTLCEKLDLHFDMYHGKIGRLLLMI
ncbi:transposase [Aliarcobacter butzleri]|uniref:transposase n=1 Tax=Aliarcobacter butzleri TaxID=28197 RepID=UPI0021B41990|nr:transposase [Aliarcobacter butzleri]MCT7585983.1 transposase [Aliarcobacter butzleri]MDN5061178.1 transposase [Aliarcobacter butzleri]